MIFQRLQKYRSNWQLLREECDRVGRQVEQWSYESLNQAAEEQPAIEGWVAGVLVRFQVDCYTTLSNGDLAISVDTYGGLPTLFGMKPSYQFFKRPDGTVYY